LTRRPTATGTVVHTLTIPRGQTVLATGQATADARTFTLRATREAGQISDIPFLAHAFKTVEFVIEVTVHDDGTWSYDEDTVLLIQGQSELFHHRDRNTLSKVADATHNPLARAQ